MLPLIQAAVEAHGWLSQEALVNFVAVSESTPGPFAVNISTYVGFEMGGIPGAACATLGVALPSFLIILLVARFYERFRASRVVSGVMSGLKPAAIGLIGSAVLTMDYDTMWNMPVSLDGVVLEETASFRSTGVYLSYRVKEAPEEWTTQMRRSLLDPTNEKGKFQGMSVSYTLGGDDTVYEPAFPEVMVQEDGTLAYTVILPLFPSDYEVLKQRGVTVRLALHAVNSFNEEPVGDTWKQTTFPENGWDITTSYQPLLSFPLELP